MWLVVSHYCVLSGVCIIKEQIKRGMQKHRALCTKKVISVGVGGFPVGPPLTAQN